MIIAEYQIHYHKHTALSEIEDVQTQTRILWVTFFSQRLQLFRLLFTPPIPIPFASNYITCVCLHLRQLCCIYCNTHIYIVTYIHILLHTLLVSPGCLHLQRDMLQMFALISPWPGNPIPLGLLHDVPSLRFRTTARCAKSTL